MKLIPKEYFLTRWDTKGKECPVGFLTPYGSTKQRIHYIEKAEQLAKRCNSSYMPEVIENSPYTGFRVEGFSFSKHQVGYQEYVSVYDPRGFIEEISFDTFTKILKDISIINGEISEECIWGNDGVNPVLLPIGSKLHEDYLGITRTSVLPKITPSMLKPGYKIKLFDVEEPVTYLGRMFELVGCLENAKQRHVYLEANGCLHVISSIKIQAILDRTEISKEDAEVITNSKMKRRNYTAQPKRFVLSGNYKILPISEAQKFSCSAIRECIGCKIEINGCSVYPSIIFKKDCGRLSEDTYSSLEIKRKVSSTIQEDFSNLQPEAFMEKYKLDNLDATWYILVYEINGKLY